MAGGRLQTGPNGWRSLGLAFLQIDFDPNPDFDIDPDFSGPAFLAGGRLLLRGFRLRPMIAATRGCLGRHDYWRKSIARDKTLSG